MIGWSLIYCFIALYVLAHSRWQHVYQYAICVHYNFYSVSVEWCPVWAQGAVEQACMVRNWPKLGYSVIRFDFVWIHLVFVSLICVILWVTIVRSKVLKSPGFLLKFQGAEKSRKIILVAESCWNYISRSWKILETDMLECIKLKHLELWRI